MPAALAAALSGALALALLLAAPALGFSPLKPPGKKVYCGRLRHRRPRRLRPVRQRLNKHPAVIQSFRTWGTDFHE